MLPAEVVDLLRRWWKARPTKRDAGVAPEQRWLFPGRTDHQPVTTRQFSRLFKHAARAAGLRKTLSLHSLRHSFFAPAQDARLVSCIVAIGDTGILTSRHLAQWLLMARLGPAS